MLETWAVWFGSCGFSLFLKRLASECPSLQELHIELNEVSEVLEVAEEQYDEVLGIVQRHTVDTISWMNNMAGQFGWVAELADVGATNENIFNITTVRRTWHWKQRGRPMPYHDMNWNSLQVENEETAHGPGDETSAPAADTRVEVNILNAPPLTLKVPGSLQPHDPSFIQYITNEALGFYKQKTR